MDPTLPPDGYDLGPGNNPPPPEWPTESAPPGPPPPLMEDMQAALQPEKEQRKRRGRKKKDPVAGEAAPKRKRRGRKKKDPAVGEEAPKRVRRGKYAAIAMLSTAVLFAALGFTGGWFANDELQSRRATATPEVIEIPAEVELDEMMVPDMRGMSLSDAKQILVDGGIPADQIKVEEQAWAGAPGIVISQDPVGGETFTDGINLLVSSEAVMPDLEGKTEYDAVTILQELGVEPEVVNVFDFTVGANTVVSTNPGEGEVLPEVAQLTVTEPGASIFLEHIRPVEGSCSTGDIGVNGTIYTNSLECSGGWEDPREYVWLLNRKAKVVTATVGVNDEDKADSQATVVFYGDGVELGRVNATYASSTEVVLEVDGVLRFEMHVLSEDYDSIVLGEALLKGTRADIDTLEKE